MNGIPNNILSDKKLLEKHIIDIYRAKGSIGGLKLLFRLLYDMDANVYLPKNDIFMASAGKWTRKQYVEVEERPFNIFYGGKHITGTTSGATAFVTISTRIFTGYQIAYVMYITDIMPGPSGSSFIVGENIVYDGMNVKDSTIIKGSPVGASIISSSENHLPGDILYTQNTTGEGIRFNVSTIQNPNIARGYIDFVLVNGGTGYAMDSPITISYLGASTGTGANFKIKSLKNTSVFRYNLNPANNMVNIRLNATSYGANLQSSNSQSSLGNSLTYSNVIVGTIDSLTAKTSGNHNYNGSVKPVVFEQRTNGYGLHDSNGGYWGNNAVILGNLATGNGVVSSVTVLSSGYGYNVDKQSIKFYNTNDPSYTVDLSITLGAVGMEEGSWEDTSGFMNSDKYITDSYYYQTYSYEIQIEKSLDKYINVLKQVMHPVGNMVFGKPIIVDSNKLQQNIVVDTLTVV